MFIRAVVFRSVLFLGFTLAYPVVALACVFIHKRERPFVWGRVAMWLTRQSWTFVGIRIKIVGAVPTLTSPILIAANHVSALDGFIINTIFNSQLYGLTIPARDFPFPFSLWSKCTPCIHVKRDWHDELIYPEALSAKQAIDTIFRLLKNGNSVLIFPEGHYERTGELHYFHTGVARLSIASSVPVCPISLSGFDKIQLRKWKLRPGVITVTIGNFIQPPAGCKVSDHEAVRQLRDKIEHTIISHLPARNIPAYLKISSPQNTTAFFDIDRTLYLGYSQQDFLKYLLEHHALAATDVLKAFAWLFEEKMGLLTHQELMARGAGIFKGWNKDGLQKTCKQFFQEHVPLQIFDNMLPYIKDHQEAGHTTVLITEVVHPLAIAFKEFFEMLGMSEVQKAEARYGVSQEKRAGF